MKPNPEKIAEAEKWLNKAVELESQNKSSTLVETAFKKALECERQAFA